MYSCFLSIDLEYLFRFESDIKVLHDFMKDKTCLSQVAEAWVSHAAFAQGGECLARDWVAVDCIRQAEIRYAHCSPLLVCAGGSRQYVELIFDHPIRTIGDALAAIDEFELTSNEDEDERAMRQLSQCPELHDAYEGALTWDAKDQCYVLRLRDFFGTLTTRMEMESVNGRVIVNVA